jgi:hypothetical protein
MVVWVAGIEVTGMSAAARCVMHATAGCQVALCRAAICCLSSRLCGRIPGCMRALLRFEHWPAISTPLGGAVWPCCGAKRQWQQALTQMQLCRNRVVATAGQSER